MEYRILGPLLVSREREQVTLDGRRNKELLSLLLLRPERGRLERPPRRGPMAGTRRPRPRKAVQVYVARLRKALGEDVLETSGAGYVLRVHDGGARRLALRSAWWTKGAGPGSGGSSARGDGLRHALALWRGPRLPM